MRSSALGGEGEARRQEGRGAAAGSEASGWMGSRVASGGEAHGRACSGEVEEGEVEERSDKWAHASMACYVANPSSKTTRRGLLNGIA
jgi:hypothetical protein